MKQQIHFSSLLALVCALQALRFGHQHRLAPDALCPAVCICYSAAAASNVTPSLLTTLVLPPASTFPTIRYVLLHDTCLSGCPAFKSVQRSASAFFPHTRLHPMCKAAAGAALHYTGAGRRRQLEAGTGAGASTGSGQGAGDGAGVRQRRMLVGGCWEPAANGGGREKRVGAWPGVKLWRGGRRHYVNRYGSVPLECWERERAGGRG